MKKQIKNRQDAIYQIALAGISAGVALLMVWLGVIVRFSTIAFFTAASIAIMIPLTQKYYFSSITAYAISAGLSFVVAGDIFAVVGYVAYFGPMAILTGIFLNTKAKWFIAYPIKVLYINGALALLFFVCNTIMVDVSLLEIKFWMVALVGTVGLLLIDLVLQMLYERVTPIVAKALRKKSSENEVVINDDDEEPKDMSDDNPFEE